MSWPIYWNKKNIWTDSEIWKKDVEFLYKKTFDMFNYNEKHTVLDIGCDYGFFCHEAKKKGAATVVGLEMNQETAKVSKEIAEIIGDGVEIVNGNVTDLANNNLEIRDNFDTILLLNVVHHLTDPIDIISKVAQLCNKMMIIEFPIPSDNKFLMRKRGYKKEGFYKNPLNKVKFKLEKGFIKLLQKRFPIIGIGGVEYHNTFYFSEKSFDNLFRLHHKSFTKIEFKKSIRKLDRVIAYCEK